MYVNFFQAFLPKNITSYKLTGLQFGSQYGSRFLTNQTLMFENQDVEPRSVDLETGKMVPGGGLEPPTRGFSVRCSTN